MRRPIWCASRRCYLQQTRPSLSSSIARRKRDLSCQPGRSLTFSRWNFLPSPRIGAESSVRKAQLHDSIKGALAWGEPIVRALPSERLPPNEAVGSPLPDSKSELPPVIRRAEVVAFALVALLIICVVAVLYAAKAFFLPVVTAFVVGTMLSPAAGFLERHRIPRSVSAVLIVSAVGTAVAFIIGLISSPLMQWSTRLPEVGSQLKDKLHIFDRPLALWQELQSMLGGSDLFSAAPFQMPTFDWVQPTIGFLSPTFTEFLLFFATLILFIASWKDLRRQLILTFADHASRLRTLRILNEIEEHLGGYLLTVTMINLGV